MTEALTRFLRLLRWEWRLSTAERTYGVTMAILASLSLLALGVGSAYSHAHRSVIDEARAKEAENLKFQRSAFLGPKDAEPVDFEQIAGRPLSDQEKNRARVLRIVAPLPTSLAYSGSPSQALLPPSPLAPLSVGRSDLWPDRAAITAWSKRKNLEREEIVNPLRLATGPFDPSSLIVIVFPLVLIALTHDLIAADRERGVLALTLSQTTPFLAVVLARLLVRVAAPTALVVATTASGLAVGGADLLDPGTASRFAAWAGLVALYAAVWGGIALVVNAFGGSSVANAIAMTAVWIVTVAVVPSAIAKGATLAAPVPPPSELITLEREVNAEAERNGKELLRRYYLDHPELTPLDKKSDPYGQARWDAIALEVDRKMGPAFERRRRQLEERDGFTGRWGMLSPALAVKAAMDDLAGTSLAHHLEFSGLAREYHTEFMDYLRPMMMTRHELSLEEFDRIPRYSGYGLATTCHPGTLWRGILVPSAWAAAFFLLAARRLLRPIASG